MYSLEYKEYDGRELYYILENGEKIVDLWSECYMALYIDRKFKEFNIVALKNAQNSDEVIDLIVSMRDILELTEEYKVNTMCQNEDDRYYSYDLRDKLWSAINNI